VYGSLFLQWKNCISHCVLLLGTLKEMRQRFRQYIPVSFRWQFIWLDDATKTVLGLCHDTIKDMQINIQKCLGSIYTPFHALAFVTDPFYDNLRANVAKRFGLEFLELGQGPLLSQCRTALARLGRSNDVSLY